MLARYFYSVIFFVFGLNAIAQSTPSDLKIKAKDTIDVIQKMDILANLQKNYYKGKLGKQFTILDLRLSEERNNSVL